MTSAPAPSSIDPPNAPPANRGEATSTAQSWLVCSAGSHGFALPLASVIETMRMLPVEAVAGAPPIVAGLCVIRGEPLAVVDTSRLFGEQTANYQRLITVRTSERTVAFAATAVAGL